MTLDIARRPYFDDYNESSLTPLKEKLGAAVSWEELKLYRASTII
jgi:hypothetical protein